MIGIETVGFLSSIILYFVSLAAPLPLGVKQQTISAESALPFATKFIEIVYVIVSLGLVGALARSSYRQS